jgi:signal transduction histidine kinase
MTQIRASVERGARQDQLEARASAIVHDTVLNELAVLATTPSGPLRPEVRRQLEATLSQLSRQDWLLGASASTKPVHTAFDAVIERCRLRGLHVTVSGERELVTTLSADVASQLFLAVEQCLANVLKHSGRTEAEVVVLGSLDEVSVMVIDDGIGFTEPAEPGDRIGLRASVRARLEELGGTAQVWSTPGAGTSVVLTVPVSAEP